MKEITLSIELANALLQYLGGRPYQEVFQLIAAMQEAAKLSQSAAADETQ
jgi:hypothetical protein